VRRIDADSLQKLSEDMRLGKPFPRVVKDWRNYLALQLNAEKIGGLSEIRETNASLG